MSEVRLALLVVQLPPLTPDRAGEVAGNHGYKQVMKTILWLFDIHVWLERIASHLCAVDIKMFSITKDNYRDMGLTIALSKLHRES